MYSAMLLESRLNYHKTLGWCHRNNRNTGHMEASGIPESTNLTQSHFQSASSMPIPFSYTFRLSLRKPISRMLEPWSDLYLCLHQSQMRLPLVQKEWSTKLAFLPTAMNSQLQERTDGDALASQSERGFSCCSSGALAHLCSPWLCPLSRHSIVPCLWTMSEPDSKKIFSPTVPCSSRYLLPWDTRLT